MTATYEQIITYIAAGMRAAHQGGETVFRPAQDAVDVVAFIYKTPTHIVLSDIMNEYRGKTTE